MAGSDKDTIYIDVDDEITGIIDKLQGSSNKVVSLVLPKRAAAFQSIVNMKLLKRAADSAGKNMVLVTTEAGLLPLAGMAGIHVAKTLSSKPEIPAAPKLAEDAEEAINEAGEVTAATAGDKPVGELAAKPPADDAMETVTLDNDKLPQESTANPPKAKSFEPPADAKGKSKAKGKKNKKLKIPDFNRFRLLLIGGILLFILLIVFIFLAIKVWPKATITIDTGAQKIDSNQTLALSPAATTLDADNNTVPAKVVQQQKTYSQQEATTGQKNNGNKASGSLVITNCSGGPVAIAAGTGFSSGGNTYISQQTVTVPDSDYGKQGNCHNNGQATVNIIAQNPGSSYNGATNFTIASSQSDLSAAPASPITGGTDNIVRSVNQNDINSAKAKINTNDPSVKSSLESQLKGDGYFVIGATYNASTPTTTTSANVGDIADSVTVTETVNYTMFGVHKSDLKTLVDNDVDTQIDTSKQKVQDEGLDNATFTVNSSSGTSGAQVTMDTKAIAGPDINIASIKSSAEGQKSGPLQTELENNPGIKSVNVNLSPFWVSSVPKDTSKIKVVIAQPKTVSNSNDSSQ